MKKLLFQFDTDHFASVFDTVVAYDGGADHVIGYNGVTPENLMPLVEGAVFTRAPKEKKNTAIFVGGSDLQAGEAVFRAIKKQYFSNFRVSLMLDSNGSNTTAAAGVAKLASSGSLQGKRAVVIAGTGPVGQRAAVMLCKEGAEVALTSRTQGKAEQACLTMQQRFGVTITPMAASDNAARAAAIADAQIVFATGAAGTTLLDEEHWADNANLEMIADANATPPLGVAGVDMMDKGKDRYGKCCWGAIGFGSFKLMLHRACIASLFEANDLVLDAEEIYAKAKEMA